MSEDKSDQESVESGSCTCSDYNEDMSWFYDSRNLKRSTMRFSIISENTSDNKIFLFKKRRQYMFDKKLSKSNNNSNNNSNNSNNNMNSSNNKSSNNLLNNSFIKRENYRKNIIKMTNSYSTKNIERKDERSNKEKKHKINLIEHPPRRKNDDIVEELRNKPKPKKKSILTHKLRNNSSSNNISPKIKKDVKIHTKKSKFLHENDKDNEQNFNSLIEKKIELNNKKNINNNNTSNIDISRSPINLTKKRIHFYHLNRTAKNNNDEPFQKKNFNSPRSRGFISPKNQKTKTKINDNKNIDENDEEQKYLNEYYNDNDKDNDKSKGIRDQNSNKNIMTKHKIVKETRNIILQPGETIKPKSITKRKLRPHTTIVKNANGKESIVTENTILTTVTVNEIVDSSNNRNSKNSQDGQLVKQYITKIYRSEIETVS